MVGLVGGIRMVPVGPVAGVLRSPGAQGVYGCAGCVQVTRWPGLRTGAEGPRSRSVRAPRGRGPLAGSRSSPRRWLRAGRGCGFRCRPGRCRPGRTAAGGRAGSACAILPVAPARRAGAACRRGHVPVEAGVGAELGGQSFGSHGGAVDFGERPQHPPAVTAGAVIEQRIGDDGLAAPGGVVNLGDPAQRPA